MKKDEILQNNWSAYLEYWRKEVRETSAPPNEERFWLWYCDEVLNKQSPQTKEPTIEDAIDFTVNG